MSEPLEDHPGPPIAELTAGQRRVLGTLLEKALTTPEVYPLTVKALTSGCNQKSNRHPTTDYSEDDVLEILDQLRQIGLVAVVHTETGRTERYRHYVRKRFTWTEPQVAVMTELLLRGRQSVGDLRARASRMVPIDSLDDLREALRGLIEQHHAQASGPLERRGVEVDHGFYRAGESKALPRDSHLPSEPDEAGDAPRPIPAAPPQAAASGPAAETPHVSDAAIRELREQNRELQGRVDALEAEIQRLAGLVGELARDLRG